MSDITLIPDEELQKDLDDSKWDVCVCREALSRGMTTYNEHPEGYLQQRLDANLHFILVIEAEQKRRVVSWVTEAADNLVELRKQKEASDANHNPV